MKSGLHVVVTIAEHACDHIFLVVPLLSNTNARDHCKYVNTKAYVESLKNLVHTHVFTIFATFMETRLKKFCDFPLFSTFLFVRSAFVVYENEA